MVIAHQSTDHRRRALGEDYARRLVITDMLVLIWVVFGVQIAWFGFDSAALGGSVARPGHRLHGSLARVIVAWLVVLAVYDTRDHRSSGPDSGVPANRRRLLSVSSHSSRSSPYVFKIDLARGYIFIAFPLGILVLMLSRWMWRQWLIAQRPGGRFSAQVLLVGSRPSVEHLAGELARHPEEGYRVVGACVPDGIIGATLRHGVPSWAASPTH